MLDSELCPPERGTSNNASDNAFVLKRFPLRHSHAGQYLKPAPFEFII